MHKHLSVVIVACAANAISGHLLAADVAFGPGTTAGNEATDFAFAGTLDRAYAFGASSSVTVGGVLFSPFASNSNGDSTNLAGPTNFSPSGVSGNYATLVSHGLSRDGAPAFIQFNNLVPGAEYEVTAIGTGLRARSDCCQAGAGYTNFTISGDGAGGTGTLEWDENDTTGRVIRGKFIADSDGRQTLNLNLFDIDVFNPLTVSANINAIVLSYTAVPEPGAWAIVVIGIGTIASAEKAEHSGGSDASDLS